MDLLPGFRWPVPRAFAAAVSVCRFEQGDLLYDAPGAYGAWGPDGAPGVNVRVQVLDPPRTARTAPSDAEGDRFAANWISPVSLELGEGRPGAGRIVRCTQGRLFSCLWRGSPELLVDVEPGAAVDPPLPRGGRELGKRIGEALPALLAALSSRPPWTVFASVVDEASEPSLAKARAIEVALESRYPTRSASLAPAEAGIEDGDAYHPTLRLRARAVPERDAELVRELLKRALYTPTRSAAESGADRFKLERHGVLVSSEEAAPA